MSEFGGWGRFGGREDWEGDVHGDTAIIGDDDRNEDDEDEGHESELDHPEGDEDALQPWRRLGAAAVGGSHRPSSQGEMYRKRP